MFVFRLTAEFIYALAMAVMQMFWKKFRVISPFLSQFT